MALIEELMGVGVPGAVATALGYGLENGATATGTTQSDAYALTRPVTQFTTVASGTGALLPNATGKGDYVVTNGGAETLAVYPASGENINGATADLPLNIPTLKTAFLKAHGGSWSAVVSA